MSYYTIGYPKVDTIRIGVGSYMGECFTRMDHAEEVLAEEGYDSYQIYEVVAAGTLQKLKEAEGKLTVAASDNKKLRAMLVAAGVRPELIP